MAKIDVTRIEGYEAMSIEDKLQALLDYEVEIPRADYSDYVKKSQFDKTASELANAKKELRNRMSEEEIARQKEADEREALQRELAELKHESAVSKNKAELLSLGYEDSLATETAEALVNGDINKVFANQKKHLDSFEKKIKSETLVATPKPENKGTSEVMTIERLRAMSPNERYHYSIDHPDEYRALYGEK